MDPLSIAASAFSLAGGIAKALVALVEFSRNARDAAADLDAISREMQALNAVLQPLVQCIGQKRAGPSVPDTLAAQIRSTIDGCKLVVGQIEENVRAYQRDNVWTKAKWAMLGQADLQKLRDSLEAYKMALSLGMHAIGMNINQAIKNNTDDIQKEVAGIRVNVDEILIRVNGIRQRGPAGTRNSRVEHWIEEMTLLSSYAETTYQETLYEPTEAAEGLPEVSDASEATEANRPPKSTGHIAADRVPGVQVSDRNALLASKWAAKYPQSPEDDSPTEAASNSGVVSQLEDVKLDIPKPIQTTIGPLVTTTKADIDTQNKRLESDLLQLQAVVRDVQIHIHDTTCFVQYFEQYLSRIGSYIDPELGSQYRIPNHSRRVSKICREKIPEAIKILNTALEEYISQLKSRVVSPLETTAKAYNKPKLLLTERKKLLPDHERFEQLRQIGKAISPRLKGKAASFKVLDDMLKKDLPKLSALTARVGSLCCENVVHIQADWYKLWMMCLQGKFTAFKLDPCPASQVIVEDYRKDPFVATWERREKGIWILQPKLWKDL